MDETITLKRDFIDAGIWSKKNRFIFQIKDDASLGIINQHKYAGYHPHAIIVKEVIKHIQGVIVETVYQFDYHYELTPSQSHQKPTIKKIKRLTTAEYLEGMFMSPTVLNGEELRWDDIIIVSNLVIP